MKLYHCSPYNQKQLQPGFNHTGVEVRWDKTESNKWLYATTDEELSLMMGYASFLEKTLNVERFITEGKKITVYVDKKPTNEEVTTRLYLYQIDNNAKDVWIKVNNKYNNADSEYKTKNKVGYKSIRPVLISPDKLHALGYQLSFVTS